MYDNKVLHKYIKTISETIHDLFMLLIYRGYRSPDLEAICIEINKPHSQPFS